MNKNIFNEVQFNTKRETTDMQVVALLVLMSVVFVGVGVLLGYLTNSTII